MHIREFTINNITSYREPTTFKFTPKLNIFIGPNGGGKTNAIQSLWLPLQRFLFSQYQIRIDDPNTKAIKPHDQMKGRYDNDLQAHNETLPTKIEITITTDGMDARNIDLIKRFSEELKLEFLPNHFTQFDRITEAHINEIREGRNLTFSIINNNFTTPPAESLESSFLSYCKLINMVSRTRNKDLSSKINNPIFFLQSLRQSSVGYNVAIAGVQHQSLHDNLNNIFSSGGTGVSALASQHFGLLMQKAVDHASKNNEAIAQNLFDDDSDVKLFRHYLNLLGYEWNLVPRGQQFGNYISEYRKDGVIIEPNKFSSGEKEIINFLDAIISTKVSNGIVLIDEPELHLHPRWQTILLDLIQEFS
jgi:putative ATP-dependent endonuclease of OLD family